MSSGLFQRIGLLFFCYLTPVYGEMRFVCPRPQLPHSDITEGPCGAGLAQPFENNYMEVSPGPLTIQLEEPIIHQGSPIRIALLEWNKNTPPCVLLDHIPHNDAAVSSLASKCLVGDYPIGHCSSTASYLTVEIPDIECDKCVLQMINVATDQYSQDQQPCYQRDPGFNNCTTFYSCANIRIRPTSKGVGKTTQSCLNSQSKLNKKWPYMPKIQYKVEMIPPFTDENYVELLENPDWSIDYKISLSNRNITVRGGSVAIFYRNRPVRFLLGLEGTVLGLTAEQRSNLQKGVYVIRATGRTINGIFKNYNLPITGFSPLYQNSAYRNHGAQYSKGGMLMGSTFAGPRASYPEVNFPAGECQAPGKESYGVIMTLFKSALPRSMATFTINRDLMYGHFASSYALRSVVLITRWNRTDGHIRQENYGFNRRGISGFFTRGAEFIGNYLLKTGGRRPVEMTNVVHKDRRSEVLHGEIQKGLQAVVKNGDDMIGLAFVTFPDTSTTANIYVMVSNSTGILSDGFKVSLTGLTKPFPISEIREGFPLDGDVFFYNVSLPITDMEIPQKLWSGMLAVTISDVTSNESYNGKLERLTTTVCEGSKNIACKVRVLLSPDGRPVDKGVAEVPPNGHAMVALGNDDTLMEVNILIQDLKPNENVKSVKLLRNGADFKVLPGFSFQEAIPGQRRLIGAAQISLTPGIIADLKEGLISLAVTTDRATPEETQISGRITEGFFATTSAIPVTTTTTSPSVTFYTEPKAPSTVNSVPQRTVTATMGIPTTTVSVRDTLPIQPTEPSTLNTSPQYLQTALRPITTTTLVRDTTSTELAVISTVPPEHESMSVRGLVLPDSPTINPETPTLKPVNENPSTRATRIIRPLNGVSTLTINVILVFVATVFAIQIALF